MTQEEKLQEAKRLYKSANADQRYVLESLFPELAESEDERIRRAIIQFFELQDDNTTYSLIPKKDIIAWLEKQGKMDMESYKVVEDEKREFVGDGFIKCYANFQDFKEGNTYWLEYIGDDKYNVRSDNLLGKTYHITPCQLYTIFKKQTWLEKQGEQKKELLTKEKALKNSPFVEQKPTDKVEPKFKVGDWIVQENIGIYKVVEVCESWYEVIDNHNNHYSVGFDKEYMCHLWTIQDAKDGDVLAAEDKDKIFIYNGKLDLRGRVCAYCGIYKTHDGLRFTECAIGNYFTYKEPYPATKEQRDTLMKAMADAGYTFDFEKKELKKLGQSEVTKTSDQEEIAEIPLGAKDSELQEATYFIPKGFHAEIDDDKVVIKKGEKPTAWSEEDETKLRQVEYACMKFYGGDCSHIDWLRKVTRPQKQWKPSDEQINTLEYYMHTLVCNEHKEILFGLYTDLKKLREE